MAAKKKMPPWLNKGKGGDDESDDMPAKGKAKGKAKKGPPKKKK